jgi:hypothetical protein
MPSKGMPNRGVGDSKHLFMKCSKVIKVCKAFKECKSTTTKLPHLGEDHPCKTKSS